MLGARLGASVWALWLPNLTSNLTLESFTPINVDADNKSRRAKHRVRRADCVVVVVENLRGSEATKPKQKPLQMIMKL